MFCFEIAAYWMANRYPRPKVLTTLHSGKQRRSSSFIVLARIHVSYWNMAFYMCVSEFKNIFEVQETNWGGQGDQIEGLKEWPINT